MSTVQTVAAVIGFLIIAATVWNIARNGIARSNGQVETYKDRWLDQPPS